MNYGCIGEKLSHSFSAEIHRRLFDYDYILKEIPRGELPAFMTEKNFSAINVTIPYKRDVIPFLDYIDDTAKQIGAVNTVVNRNGKLYGYNTDYSGMCELIKKANIDLCGKKALILGSGGTSKTASAVAKNLGCREVFRVSRSNTDGCITYEEALSEHSDTQIIINTTPCGMYPDIYKSAVDIARFENLCGVVDAVYNPLRSKLVCDAKSRGITAIGGLFMLVAQAAFAAEKFTDTAVESEKIDRIYKEMLYNKENIVLVGMPACGKSTVGKLLSENSGMDFCDTDSLIEEKCGRKISEIFAECGEEGFRKIESEVIKSVATRQHTVIATGGGAILNEENIALLRENGRIYFLDRPLELLVSTDDRPLSSNRAALEKRYKERYSLYLERCDVRIDAAGSAEDTESAVKEDFYNEIFGY